MLGKWVVGLGLWGVIMSAATGCISMTTVRPSAMGRHPAGTMMGSSSSCDSCTSCTGGQGSHGFYSGPGPLSRFFGVVGCGTGGCGELYVDEWINEPPRADHCPSNECLTCGLNPLQNLFHLFMGRQYLGGCDTCTTGCDAGGCTASRGIQGEQALHGMASSSGCNCSHSGGSEVSRHMGNEQIFYDDGAYESVDPTATYGPAPSRRPNASSPIIRNPVGGSVVAPAAPTPTPAPHLSGSSAARFNPAARRVVR
jgi:hypothetical protein